MNKVYDKNYANTDLTIPAQIWNDKTINGIQKMMLALYKKMTRDGQKPIDVLTRVQAQIFCTHEQDIHRNLVKLVEKGYIEVFGNIGSKTKLSLFYTYKPTPPKNTEIESGNSLF